MKEEHTTGLMNLISLMREIESRSSEIVIRPHTGDLNYRRKKYLLLRMVGIAHVLFSDSIDLIGSKSIRTVEVLHRPLVEVLINFTWISTGKYNRNYSLYVADDNEKMAKHVDYILDYLSRTGASIEGVEDWKKVKQVNIRQAAEVRSSSKYVTEGDRCPSIYERAKQVDEERPNLKNSTEWLALFPYHFAHNATHTTNRQLNSILHAESDEIELYGSDESCTRVAFDVTLTYLALLENYCDVFRIKGDLKDFWKRLN